MDLIMDTPLLEFVTELYPKPELDRMMAEFRDLGFVILPQVFKRETVDAFAEQVKAALFFDGLEWDLPGESPLIIWPALAPRVRQVLTPALSHSVANPLPSLYMNRWLIQSPEDPNSVPKWHKDREPDGMPGKEYHYPKDVFVGMYFDDLTWEKGPTRIIPGSHRDLTLLPNVSPDVPAFCNKEDALLIDQRTWHCGSPRKVPGLRILAVYGYYPVPLHYSFCFKMPEAQRQAWLKATKRVDRVYFGGPFQPPPELKSI